MALSNYTDLLSAISSETAVGSTGLSSEVIADAIKRAESKINRRARLREMEQLAYQTYYAGTASLSDRLMSLPSDYVELLNLRAKPYGRDDSNYVEVPYVTPDQIHLYYRSPSSNAQLRYTLRKQIEFSHAVTSNHIVMMHYLKRWDIATDSTNWLLTNYPDVYLYGALAECEMHLKNDERIPVWKAFFDAGIDELNDLSERGRDDSELDVSDVARLSSSSMFNIVTG